MCVIFYFSSQVGEASDESSITIVEHVLNIYQQIGNEQATANTMEYYIIKDTLNLIVRKLAHITIFAILNFFLCIHVLTYHVDGLLVECTKEKGESPKIWVSSPIGISMIASCITLLYASLDEFHQRFTPGRSGNLIDVGIDSIGIICSGILFLLLYKLILRFVIFVANRF